MRSSSEVRAILRQRFDDGLDLFEGLELDLRRYPDCLAYARRLQAINAALREAPLAAPRPQLMRAIKAQCASQKDEVRRAAPAALAITAVLALAMGAVGWLFPHVFDPARYGLSAGRLLVEWQSRFAVNDLLAAVRGFWAEGAAWLDRMPDVSVGLAAGCLAGCVAALIAFNGLQAVQLRGHADHRRWSQPG